MKNDSKAQSITHKLQSIAFKEGVFTQQLRTDFLLERLIARLSTDETIGNNLVFKGGVVSKKVYNSGRFTFDIDVALKSKEGGSLISDIEGAISRDLDDASWFQMRDRAPLKLQVGDGGERVRLFAGIGETPANLNKATTLSIDISPTPVTYSRNVQTETLLNESPLNWEVCACELTVAEKIHALISRGSDSTRARDVYDLSKLTAQCNPVVLKEALSKTFEQCGRDLPKDVVTALRKIDTTRLEEAWASSLYYVGPRQEFDTAWNSALYTLKEKLSSTLEQSSRKSLLEGEKRLLRERRNLGFVGSDGDALYGLGGYPKELTRKEALSKAQQLVSTDKGRKDPEILAKKLLEDDAVLIKKRKEVEEALLLVRKELREQLREEEKLSQEQVLKKGKKR